MKISPVSGTTQTCAANNQCLLPDSLVVSHYLRVIFYILRLRDECHRLALEQDLGLIVNFALFPQLSGIVIGVAYHGELRQASQAWVVVVGMVVG